VGRRYLFRKSMHAAATLFFVLAFNFVLFRVMPGDPISLLTRSERLTPADVADLRAEYGLDQPLPQQFVNYLGDVLTFDLGVSLRSGVPVSTLIGERVWPTVLLVGIGTLLATVLGVLIGIKGGWSRGSRFDTTTLYGSLLLYAMPEGWLGMLLLITFAGTLGWLPAGGYQSDESLSGFAHVIDVANHLLLPCLTLTLGYIGEYAIVMRSALLETVNEDYIQTARAKGLSDRMVRRRHAVPNAILPTFTLIFLSFGYLLGGAIVIEAVFSWPGLGQLTYQSISQLDYPVIQAIFLITSAMVILFNLAADLMYGLLDPRVRHV
jgi:peptide/nickel transport system permease protein